mgnify:CR=1 FL=1
MTTAVAPLSGSIPSTKLADKAQEFEAVFAAQICKLLLENVTVDEQFGGGHGEEMFRGILAEQLGAEVARTSRFQIAPAVLTQLMKMQEAQP